MSRDVHELRFELQRHVSRIDVDGQGQLRIEGTLVGALDAVLKVVAGARWTANYGIQIRWIVVAHMVC